jgi:hypothetical protein
MMIQKSLWNLGSEDLDSNDILSRYGRYKGVYHPLVLQEAIGEKIGNITPIRRNYLVVLRPYLLITCLTHVVGNRD